MSNFDLNILSGHETYMIRDSNLHLQSIYWWEEGDILAFWGLFLNSNKNLNTFLMVLGLDLESKVFLTLFKAECSAESDTDWRLQHVDKSFVVTRPWR